MKQTHVHTFDDGNQVICTINLSRIKQLLAHDRLRTPQAALECLDWKWKSQPTPGIMLEYRTFAQRMYGLLAKSAALKILVKGPSKILGIDEAWIFDEEGKVTIEAIPTGVPEIDDVRPVDFDFLQKHGRISQADAQSLHAQLCRMAGMTDPLAIEAAWNVQSPLAEWNCEPEQCNGVYVQELTSYVLRYMEEKLEEKRTATATGGDLEVKRFRVLKPKEPTQPGDRFVNIDAKKKLHAGLPVPKALHGKIAGSIKARLCRVVE